MKLLLLALKFDALRRARVGLSYHSVPGFCSSVELAWARRK
jgi:hypothetical protein